MRPFLCFLAVALTCARAEADAPNAIPVPAIDQAHMPWIDGEKLTYLVTWLGFDAAQGVFTAKWRADHWEYHLDLASRGTVNHIYPFTGQFWCILGATLPWRSIEYGEYRFEPQRTVKERTRIDYATKKATRENWAKGETKTYTVAEDSIDDIGTMLYHVRAASWQPNDQHTVYVYESNSEKQGEVTFAGRETRAFGAFPAQPLLKISMLPTAGTHHKGHLTIWMTDDARPCSRADTRPKMRVVVCRCLNETSITLSRRHSVI
jgi:hypothetical protein